MNQLKFVKSWFPFGTADPSPDFFHSCAEEGFMGVPSNMFGKQQARTGESYVGMITYLTTKSGRGWKVPANHREFIMTQLTKPLVAGNQYYAEFWVNLADNCEFAINKIGMRFTRDLPGYDWKALDLGYYTAQVNNESGRILNDNEGWVKVSGTFTAKGDELALSIGTFDADKDLKVKKTKRKYANGRDPNLPKQYQPIIAYYYIDDVRVTPVDPQESIFVDTEVTASVEDEYFGPAEIGKKFTLQNIYFEFDKANLLRGSFLELNKLYEYMSKHNRVKIQIEGHTDNVGSRDYNQKLSAARAKAVAQFLIGKGINEFRIEYKGFGSSQPVMPNTTEENRALNRRVEFLILEN